MTEAEWLACTSPRRMLAHLYSIPAYQPGRPTARKFRLFACAAVRVVWEQVADVRARQAIEVAERFAEGLAGAKELIAARVAALQLSAVTCGPVQLVYKAAHKAAGWDAALAAEDAAADLRRFEKGAGRAQSALLRDMFGPLPFRLVSLDPSWLSWNEATVPKLVNSIAEERRPEGLPVLADALEEAGCDNADVLTHCRGPGEHVRGCWVIDLVLGRQ
jgi:hypothetical protein